MLTRITSASRWPSDAAGPTRDAACVSADEVAATRTSSTSSGAAAMTVASRNQRLRSTAMAAASPNAKAIQAPRL